MSGLRQYGIRHTPLIAEIVANKRKPDQVVAFIAGQLCFFERGTFTPQAGDRAEVMITRPTYGSYGIGSPLQGGPDYTNLRALMIEVVDPLRHVLVAIDGFECAGSMCRTTSYGVVTDGAGPLTSEDVFCDPRSKRRNLWLTPGRCGIRVADNTNTRFYKQQEKPRNPTNVWVERAILDEKGGCGVRVAGLTRLEDGEWARHMRQRLAA